MGVGPDIPQWRLVPDGRGNRGNDGAECMTPAQREAVEALERYGNKQAAADTLGISRSTLRTRLERATRDPAIQASMDAVGTELVPALAWAKTKSEDGTSYSVLLKPAQDAPEDAAERIRAALEGMEPAEPVVAPEAVLSDLCSVYPLMDAHIGMMAWGRETGADDYDLTHAAQDMRHAFAKVLART